MAACRRFALVFLGVAACGGATIVDGGQEAASGVGAGAGGTAGSGGSCSDPVDCCVVVADYGRMLPCGDDLWNPTCSRLVAQAEEPCRSAWGDFITCVAHALPESVVCFDDSSVDYVCTGYCGDEWAVAEQACNIPSFPCM